MGLEARCEVTWNGEKRIAAVHLDSSAIDVRGKPKLTVRFSEVKSVGVQRGRLVVETKEGVLALALGAAAETWATKIRQPKSRLSKFGVREGDRVAIVSVADDGLAGELTAARARVVPARGQLDVVFFGVRSADNLARLITLRELIAPAGAVWRCAKKGKRLP